jgi:hypothetical protein
MTSQGGNLKILTPLRFLRPHPLPVWRYLSAICCVIATAPGTFVYHSNEKTCYYETSMFNWLRSAILLQQTPFVVIGRHFWRLSPATGTIRPSFALDSFRFWNAAMGLKSIQAVVPCNLNQF